MWHFNHCWVVSWFSFTMYTSSIIAKVFFMNWPLAYTDWATLINWRCSYTMHWFVLSYTDENLHSKENKKQSVLTWSFFFIHEKSHTNAKCDDFLLKWTSNGSIQFLGYLWMGNWTWSDDPNQGKQQGLLTLHRRPVDQAYVNFTRHGLYWYRANTKRSKSALSINLPWGAFKSRDSLNFPDILQECFPKCRACHIESYITKETLQRGNFEKGSIFGRPCDWPDRGQ